LRKQLLFAVFLLCVLTLTSFTALTSIQVNGALSDAKILRHSRYIIEADDGDDDTEPTIGALVVVGELQNVGATNIYRVYVVGFARINGVEVARSVPQLVFGNNLNPGQKAPFYIKFGPENILLDINDLAWEDVTDVTVSISSLANTDKSMYPDLTVSSEGYTSDNGVYTVDGTVKNVGTGTIGDVRVITTFYNSAGTVVSLNYTNVLSNSLSSGSSKVFTATPIEVYPGIDTITSYATLVQSTVEPPDSPSTSDSPNINPTPTPTNTFPSPTATQTPKGITLSYSTIIIIATILAVVFICMTFALIAHRKHIKPTPTN
jgi:hypothetical protein